MNKNLAKVVDVKGGLTFDNGLHLDSEHEQDCCEQHYLSFHDLTLQDFDGLEFDLSSDDFFKRIEDYGIALKPIKGHSVKIPGYGSNNGYYSCDLSLCLYEKGNVIKRFDITSCQVIND